MNGIVAKENISTWDTVESITTYTPRTLTKHELTEGETPVQIKDIYNKDTTSKNVKERHENMRRM